MSDTIKIIVSQCLYGGKPVRYDGKIKEEKDSRFLRWKEEGILLPVCPEILGGLPVPRSPAQIREEKVINSEGEDVTAEYMIGAEKTLKAAIENNFACAVFKEKSPSCGSHFVYDGSFSGELIPGEGITARIVREAGIPVFSERELDKVEALLREIRDE